jgi:hypothetical protein
MLSHVRRVCDVATIALLAMACGGDDGNLAATTSQGGAAGSAGAVAAGGSAGSSGGAGGVGGAGGSANDAAADVPDAADSSVFDAQVNEAASDRVLPADVVAPDRTTVDAGLDAFDAGRPLGMPIVAPARTWTWIDFPEARCRSGSGTGIGVNWNPGSTKLVVFLEPGGACFSPQSCGQNPASRDAMFGNGGIFDRNRAGNPFAEFNLVFVPYCTGDWYAGNNPRGNVPGVGAQQFVGYTNLDLFLDRLVPTFPDATQVVLTGSSAGGLGAFFNASHFARRFGTIPVVAIADSGPPTSTQAMPACFQTLMRTLWNLDATVLADCGADCPKHDDYLVDLTMHYARGAGHSTGILNSYDDAVDITWYNMGAQACSPPAPSFGAPVFESALMDLRRTGGGSANRFATYYVPSTSHVWLGNDGETVNGTRLGDWVHDLLAGTYHDVGP